MARKVATPARAVSGAGVDSHRIHARARFRVRCAAVETAPLHALDAPSPARSLAAPRFASLDGLRCLAIVPVVWHHATPRAYDGVLGRGPLGVDLFFVISGFLITTLLLRERQESGTVALGAFYVRRSLRIFPLYYAVLGAFVLHAIALREHGPVRDHFLRSVPMYATYTSNWFGAFDVAHPIVFSFAWSLATEEQFYLVWPWVIVATGWVVGRAPQKGSLALPRKGSLALPALFMALLLVVDQAVERGWTERLLALGPLATRIVRSVSTPICLGSLLALGLRSPRVRAVLEAVLARRPSAPLALGALVVIAVLGWPLLHAHLAMVALVGACVIRPDHGLRRPLELRSVAHVGLVSYGVYLVNVPVIVATRKVLGPASASAPLVFAVGLTASVAVATLTYRFVETPFLRLRDRLRRPRRSPRSDALHVHHEGARVSGSSMLPDVERLPRAEREPALRDGHDLARPGDARA